MQLAYRAIQFEDFEKCWDLTTCWRSFPPASKNAVKTAWRQLLNRKALIGAVVEDQASPAPYRTVGFGTTVFVSDSFMHLLQTDSAPYLLGRLFVEYDRYKTAILDEPQIAEANAGTGLNLAIVHKGWNTNLLEATPKLPPNSSRASCTFIEVIG